MTLFCAIVNTSVEEEGKSNLLFSEKYGIIFIEDERKSADRKLVRTTERTRHYMCTILYNRNSNSSGAYVGWPRLSKRAIRRRCKQPPMLALRYGSTVLAVYTNLMCTKPQCNDTQNRYVRTMRRLSTAACGRPLRDIRRVDPRCEE